MSIDGVQTTELKVAAQATPTTKERLLALTNFLGQGHFEQAPRTKPVADGHLYSILGKSPAPLLPTPLLPTVEAIRQLDERLVETAARNPDPSRLDKWNSFKQEALENRNHLLYNHVESTRALEFQEDVNLFLVAVNTSLEKNPAELDTVLFLLTSELDVCRPGILGRFHNSVWPMANNSPLSSELPYLTLRMIDNSKTKVIEEIVSTLFGSEVHWRNALYQAENNRFGLGFRKDQLGPDEWATPHFIQAQMAPGIQPYGNYLKERFDDLLSIESIAQAAAPFYAHKASQEKAPFHPKNLIQELLHFYDMHEDARDSLVIKASFILQNTPLFQQICKDLTEGVLHPELTIDKDLNTAFQNALGIPNMEKTLERLQSDTPLLNDVISKTGAASLISELFYEEETGSFNEFALLFILKYSGLIEEIQTEINLSTLKGAFLAQVNGKQVMIDELATALTSGRLVRTQIPESILPLDLDYYRENPTKILNLSAAALARLSPEALKEFTELAYTQITEQWLNATTPPILKMCPKFVLAAVTRDGWTLAFADAELKKDPTIVLAAVTQNGFALRSTDAELKKDRAIVLAAVRQNGLALEYADDALKTDPEILAAVSRR